MPHLTLPISGGGPILELAVGVSEPRKIALEKAGKEVPKHVKIRGLVDTGASGTCVDPLVIKHLALTPTGKIDIHTPSTAGQPHSCSQYDVSMIIIHPELQLVIGELPIVESNLNVQGIQALIGRDILSQCLLVYNGETNEFALAF